MLAAQERARDVYRAGLWTAWHAAAFARQKRMPDLARLVRRFDGRQPAEQSPDEMLEQVKLLAASWGVKMREA